MAVWHPMKMPRFEIVLLVLLAALLEGCNLVPYYYRGDGVFDNRWGYSAHERYLLTLGEFNSSDKKKATYQIGKLPCGVIAPKKFHIGLSPVGIDLHTLFTEKYEGRPGTADRDSNLKDMAVVNLKLTDNTTGRVIEELHDSLSNWTWTTAGGGVNGITEVRFGYITFEPKRNHTYSLYIEILRLDGYGVPMVLEMTGGNDALYAIF